MRSTRTRIVESAVHLPYNYITEDLLTIDGSIWRYGNNPNPE